MDARERHRGQLGDSFLGELVAPFHSGPVCNPPQSGPNPEQTLLMSAGKLGSRSHSAYGLTLEFLAPSLRSRCEEIV